MNISLRIPANYSQHPELIVTGFDGRIDYRVADCIKQKFRFSEFAAWGISGKVWWDKTKSGWLAEIWKKQAYVSTVTGETIEDLVFNIQKSFGWK